MSTNLPKKVSKYRGVSWHAATGKWMVKIKARFGKIQLVGRFDDEIQAASAYAEDFFLNFNSNVFSFFIFAFRVFDSYDIAARELYGAKALTNFSIKEASKNVGDTFKIKPKEEQDHKPKKNDNTSQSSNSGLSVHYNRVSSSIYYDLFQFLNFDFDCIRPDMFLAVTVTCYFSYIPTLLLEFFGGTRQETHHKDRIEKRKGKIALPRLGRQWMNLLIWKLSQFCASTKSQKC